MQDKLQGPENSPAVTERRACPRFRVTSLMYIDIGTVNGGIVTSLSEKGLALAAADTLVNGEFGVGSLQMRIQVPGVLEALEANGEIVWTSASGKEACVRFLEIGDKAREEVRRWISNQASGNGLRPDPPTLPKMKLPSSRRARVRPSRFSFSDVASSRVDAESETGVEDFPEIATNPGELPPLQVEGAGLRDGTQAVASAFGSRAFRDNQTEEIRSDTNRKTTQAIPEAPPRQQPSPAVPERRQHSRRPILLFTYAVLSEDNGGLVFNLSEGGLALTAAAPLQERHFNNIRVRFPDSADWFEAGGRLVWKNESGKEAGLEFAGLPEEARLRIKDWVLQEEPTSDLRTQENVTQTTESPVSELPSFMDPDAVSAEPFEIPASFEEQSFENPPFEEQRFENETKTPSVSSSALFKTGIKGILERASVRRRVAKIKPPRTLDHSAKPQTRLARKALSVAAGVALALGGWMFFQRNSSNEASGIIAQNLPATQSSQEATQEPNVASTEAGAPQTATDPPVHSEENVATEEGTAQPSARQFASGSPPSNTTESNTTETPASSNANFDRASKEKSPSERGPRKSDQPQRISSAGRELHTKAAQVVASARVPPLENKPVENSPAETKPAQIAQVLPTVNANKESNVRPPALNSNPPQPTAPPSVDLAKEKPSVAPKQPEPILARTPVVTVNFDPYPSIRMPKTEKSKKSRQGTTLQMGRLLTRVDPVYPEEAKQQGAEGTVRVHAIFNRDGTVQSVISISGPPLLVPAAINAVRQWRYSQTILGGQAMETEEDITMLFRLTNSAAKN